MYLVEHVTAEDFDSKVLGGGKKAVVLFYASWCPYCANFKPSFEGASMGSARKLETIIDEDENPLWDRFNIQAVPTMIAFENGKIISRRDAKKSIGLTRADLNSMSKEIS